MTASGRFRESLLTSSVLLHAWCRKFSMPRNYEAEDGGRREAWWRHVLSLVRCESAMLCDCATGVLKLVCRRRERRREQTGGARAVTSSWANPPACTGNSLRTLGLSLCVSYRPRSLKKKTTERGVHAMYVSMMELRLDDSYVCMLAICNGLRVVR